MWIAISLGVLTLIVILMYNTLISRKNQVENIFASVDALLQKRYNVIPNLVATVKEYMQYEKDLLEKITKLRSNAMRDDLSDEEKIELDREFSSTLKSIMVAVENYPELKANRNFLHLQETINEIEEQISAARRAYNQAVTDYNNAIEMFPTNIIANYLHYRRKKPFEAQESAKVVPNIKELFK